VSGKAGTRCLILWLALVGVRPSWAQDSLPRKGSVKPFAVPEILEPEPTPPRPPLPPADPAALASSAVAALMELRDGISSEDWRRGHPDEVGQLYKPELALIDAAPWCVRFSRRWAVPHGRTVSRHAFFFLPEGAGISFPLPNTAALERCRLGAVWLSFEEPDTLVGDSLAATLRAALAIQFPVVSETLPALTRWPARRTGSSWRSGSMLLETAFREGEMVVAASFPFALEEENLQCYPQCALEESTPAEAIDRGISIIRQAAAIAALPPARLGPVLRLLADVRAASALTDTGAQVPAPRLVGVLRRWLADSGRSARARAATLLVADRLLTLGWSSVDQRARAQLTALGAQVVKIPAEGSGYAYDSNWLRLAYVLDVGGPLGALAMTEMIRGNFPSVSDCRADGYTEVIRLVEPFLATPAGARSAPAHLALADAYRDMLTLASGGGSESFERIERLERATPEELLKTRNLALSHYRAAFALDRTSAQARVSRADASRLSAGLVPTQTRYGCTYD
jgi:hypothetical protein